MLIYYIVDGHYTQVPLYVNKQAIAANLWGEEKGGREGGRERREGGRGKEKGKELVGRVITAITIFIAV